MITLNKNSVLIAIAGVSLLIAIVLLVNFTSGGKVLAFLGTNPSHQAIAQKAVDYINSNGFVGAGQTAAIESVSEENGLIKIRLKIGTNNFDSYATKDGELLFPTAFKLNEPPK